MLMNMKDLLKVAQENHFAVPAFNIGSDQLLKAVMKKVNELKSPVILEMSPDEFEFVGYGQIQAMIYEASKTDVPVVIHLDHGDKYETVVKAIQAGMTSVMIDASKHELEENIRITKEVVDYAHAHGVSVEAELGHVGGQEDNVVSQGVLYADPNECVKLVNETKIDALAPALGSVHGPYHGEPKLGFKEMAEIAGLVKMPLVLHGGSGIPDYQIKKAIECGTCKINVNTECQMAFTKIVREVVAKDSEVYDPRKVIGPGKEGIKEVVREKCEIFGCINKA